MNAKAIWRRMSFWFIRNVGAFESSTKFRRISFSYKLKTAKLPLQCPFKLQGIPDSSTWKRQISPLRPKKGWKNKIILRSYNWHDSATKDDRKKKQQPNKYTSKEIP